MKVLMGNKHADNNVLPNIGPAAVDITPSAVVKNPQAIATCSGGMIFTATLMEEDTTPPYANPLSEDPVMYIT